VSLLLLVESDSICLSNVLMDQEPLYDLGQGVRVAWQAGELTTMSPDIAEFSRHTVAAEDLNRTGFAGGSNS
jgi:hypothetical protein